MGITAVIGTKNSARHLERVLARLKNFDEVLVCDMNSTDNTVEIAKRHGCSTVLIPSTANKQDMMKTAFHRAKSEWLLFLAPGDLVPPALVDYLRDFVKDSGNWRAVRIPRKNFLMHRWDKRSYPDFQLRFVHRDHVTWPNKHFDEPLVDGDIWRVPFDREDLALIRIPVSLPTLIDDAERRARIKGKSSEAPVIRVVWRPFATFLSEYFLKERFRFGSAGFITAINKSIEQYHYLTRRHEERMMQRFMEENDRAPVATPESEEEEPETEK